MLDLEMLYAQLDGKEPYKTLPKIIDRYQYRYTQVFRKGRIALYKQEHRPNIQWKSMNVHYEVIIIRIVKGDKQLGIPPREAYPSTIDWGVKGWTFFTYEEATTKVGELLMQGKFK